METTLRPSGRERQSGVDLSGRTKLPDWLPELEEIKELDRYIAAVRRNKVEG